MSSPLVRTVSIIHEKSRSFEERNKYANKSEFLFGPDTVKVRLVALQLFGYLLLWISHQWHPSSPFIYTWSGRSSLLPIHHLQWEDSPLRINFMPIHGQRMWRASPNKETYHTDVATSRSDPLGTATQPPIWYVHERIAMDQGLYQHDSTFACCCEG